LDVAHTEIFFVVKVLTQFVTVGDEDGHLLESELDLGVVRVLAVGEEALHEVVGAVALLDEVPELLIHELKMLVLVNFVLQVDVIHIFVESLLSTGALKVFLWVDLENVSVADLSRMRLLAVVRLHLRPYVALNLSVEDVLHVVFDPVFTYDVHRRAWRRVRSLLKGVAERSEFATLLE